MPNHAHVTLIGHLGQDPETKQIGDTSVTNFSIATTEKQKGKEDITSWWSCAAWGKTGELIAQYAKKGDPLLVNGRPYQEQYAKKDGTTGHKVSVRVGDFTFLGNRRDEGHSEDGMEKAKAVIAAAASSKSRDDGIPF